MAATIDVGRGGGYRADRGFLEWQNGHVALGVHEEKRHGGLPTISAAAEDHRRWRPSILDFIYGAQNFHTAGGSAGRPGPGRPADEATEIDGGWKAVHVLWRDRRLSRMRLVSTCGGKRKLNQDAVNVVVAISGPSTTGEPFSRE